MNISKVIGLQLRLARIEKGKTITWVADQLGVAKNTISYMELGKKKNVSVEDIVNYCEVIGYEWPELFRRIEAEYVKDREIHSKG